MTQAGLFDRPRSAAPVDDWHSLRWYQKEACEQLVTGFEENRSQLAVLATGLGKSVIAGALARYWLRHGKGNVLMLANRDELVQQGAGHLARMCGETCEIEQAQNLASRKARLVMASIDTIKQQHRLDRFGRGHFGLIIADECFPAGTLIDGVPIERIAEGDTVRCIDHSTGRWTTRKVTRRSSKLAPSTVTLYTGATSLECTGNHPVYIRRGENVGYVQASRIVPGDLLCVWLPIRAVNTEAQPQAEDLLSRVSVQELLSSDGSDEPPLSWCKFKANDGEQSDVFRRGAAKDERDAESNEARASNSRGERHWAIGGGSGNRASFRLGDERGGKDRPVSGVGVPSGLQAGRGLPAIDDRDRGGWLQSFGSGEASAGLEEGEVLAWSRVDRVARNEPTSPGGTRVYNFEVEGCHTYFANGALVHNCQHFVGNTYVKPLDYFQDAKVLGLTATPDRADEKALGQVFDAVGYVRDILAGIEDGYLVPITGRQVELGEIQLDGLAKVAGDLAKGQLDEVMVRAVEGVVHKVLELEPHRRAIAFWPGIKSAEYAMERFNALDPGSTCFIHGGSEENERKRLVADFRRGAIKRLMNVGIAIEGFDAPATDLIIQARPTLSRMFYAQSCGRGTRVLPGTVDHLDGAERAAERRAAVAASAKPFLVVMDFVGNATKHALIGPEDLLGGDYEPAEIELAKKKAKKGETGDVKTRLEDARRELAAVAAAVRSKVTAQVKNFNPFAVLEMDLTSTTRDDMRWGRQPPTERQLLALKNMKVPDAAIKAMSQREASKLLTERNKRYEAGLASYAQLAHLRKFGLDNKDVTFQGAGRALTYVAQNHWNPARVDVAKLTELALGKQ